MSDPASPRDAMSARILAYFDQLADGEWARFEEGTRARASLEVHRRFLSDHVHPGARVLEIGAGPGRFTLQLVELGAKVVVTDVSEVQLSINRARVVDAGGTGSVEAWRVLDVRDVATLDVGTFDLVLAYGGPLSYVFDDARDALRGLHEVGDVVVGSVMATLGTLRRFLPQVLALDGRIGRDRNDAIFRTGDLRLDDETSGHTCKLYRAAELRALVEDAGGEVLDLSASNWLSLDNEAVLEAMSDDAAAWARFVEWEVEACRVPGVLDAAPHLLFASRARAGSPAS